MPERRLPTLAEAQRQVRVRSFIGSLLIGLSLIFMLLVLAKDVYLNLSGGFFFPDFGSGLRRFIDPLLRDWFILDLLWRAMPPRKSRLALPTAPAWEYMYALWSGLAVGGIGKWLRWSAHERRMEIRDYLRGRRHETWREQDRVARGLPPDDRGPTAVPDDSLLWSEAPRESFGQSTIGIVILGLIVTVAGGLLLLWAEYGYFQPRWSAGRN
jgi:hypothetical protein